MAIRKPVYYNTVNGEFQRTATGDVLNTLIGTEVILGESAPAFDLLYIDPVAGKAFKADATVDAKRNVVFIALEGGILDDAILVAFPGQEIPGMSGLTINAKYWVNPAAAGKITSTPLSTDGHWVIVAGVASAATKLVFNPEVKVKL